MFNAPNNIFQNINKDIYIAKKIKPLVYDDYNNEILTYEKPFYLGNMNYQPLSGNDLMSYISAYGETKNKLVRMFIDVSYKGKFDEFDVAYLYGNNPTDEKIYGDNANYIIRTCAEQNTKIMIIFEEIIKEGN